MPDELITFYLTRNTTSFELGLLGNSPVNDAFMIRLSHEDDDSWPLGGLTISAGGRWTAHTLEYFGDPDPDWQDYCIKAIMAELKRLEADGSLPAEWKPGR